MPEIIKIATLREGGNVLLWVAASSEEKARAYVERLGPYVQRSRWAGRGHYRSDVYIVEARSIVPREASAI